MAKPAVLTHPESLKRPAGPSEYAKDPVNASMSKAEKIALYTKMARIRHFEQRCIRIYQKGKIGGFLHLYPGQEACCNGVMEAARPGHDYVITGYRDHVHAIKCGANPKEVMAELYGKETGSSKGRGGSMHFYDVANGFMGGWGIVGGQLPVAAITPSGMRLFDPKEVHRLAATRRARRRDGRQVLHEVPRGETDPAPIELKGSRN